MSTIVSPAQPGCVRRRQFLCFSTVQGAWSRQLRLLAGTATILVSPELLLIEPCNRLKIVADASLLVRISNRRLAQSSALLRVFDCLAVLAGPV